MSGAVIAVDTSSFLSIILGEADAETHAGALVRSAAQCVVGAPTLVETEIVLAAKAGEDAVGDLHLLLERVSMEVVAFEAEHVRIASAAWRRFGKGRHAAALNLGDCFSYATAKLLDAPLLYKGRDFRQTDVRSVLD